MQQWHEDGARCRVTWDATFPNQGSRTLKWDGGKKARYCLSTVSFLFPGDLSDNGIQNCYVAACLHSLLDFTLSVKLYLVKCKGEDLQKPYEKAAGQNLGLKDPFNLEGLTYKLTQITPWANCADLWKSVRKPKLLQLAFVFSTGDCQDQWNAQFGGQALVGSQIQSEAWAASRTKSTRIHHCGVSFGPCWNGMTETNP